MSIYFKSFNNNRKSILNLKKHFITSQHISQNFYDLSFFSPFLLTIYLSFQICFIFFKNEFFLFNYNRKVLLNLKKTFSQHVC